jgi:phosphoribosylformimino-5-aminoimidazole carboxamide ribotide isomerase
LTAFRPCIDLHQGKVKQIVGGSLSKSSAMTNFVSDHGSDYYADLYKSLGLQGGHVISLGSKNQQSVLKALAAYPQGLQFGGGVNIDNAIDYLNAGASKVIVTSYLFEEDRFSWQKLSDMSALVGADNLVLDLSCRQTDGGWMVATDRWQTITDVQIDHRLIEQLQPYCAEFLIHSADVEGLQAGIDEDLVSLLGQIVSIPTTYAGGATSLQDVEKVKELSQGKVDLTIGSALDIFGGSGVTLDACVKWNQKNST